MDREDKESLQHLKHLSFSCDAAWKLWKHWDMVIDFILFCWTWSTQTELENKSASSIDLKASLDLKSIFKRTSLDMDSAISKKTCQKCSPDALRLTTERGFLDWTHRGRSALCAKQVKLYWQTLPITARHFSLCLSVEKHTAQDQLTLMQLLQEYNKTREKCWLLLTQVYDGKTST